MDDYRKSLLLCTLNLIPPNTPSFWAHLSPLPPVTEDAILQLKISFVIKSELPRALLVFPTAMMRTEPYNSYIKPPTTLL